MKRKKFFLIRSGKLNEQLFSCQGFKEITPPHNEGEVTNKENYRSVSVLPSVAKVFESNMYNQIYNYVSQYLPPYLHGYNAGKVDESTG